MTADDPREAPGWDSITTAFGALYGMAEPAGHWAPHALSDSDPLPGVSCYSSREGTAHWHYVSYGLTELYHKESDDPEVSGFGFELTIRVLRDPGEDEPPLWPVSLFQNLARYVFASGNGFGPGHHMPGEGPLGDEESELCALAFTSDPLLSPRQSPNGRFAFVHLVGITLDELRAIEL